MTRPTWPLAAGRGDAKAAEVRASRAADLEAQAAALGRQMAADLIGMLEVSAIQAADVAALSSTPLDVRQLADKIAADHRSRAASLRQMLGLKPGRTTPTTEAK